MSAVGIIVNPWAGKDVRRLHAPVGHTPDTAKIGIVRRVAVAALAAGAERVVAAADLGRIAERAIHGVHGGELIDGPQTGSALDSRRAATQMSHMDCSLVVVLGGDGTCRDVAMGWPGVVMLPISTGTNNVFPRFVDGTSAGAAAGLIASGLVAAEEVGRIAKRLTIEIHLPNGDVVHDVALVDVGVISAEATGARAVVHADQIRAVVAVVAEPASTGLSAIAGVVQPLAADEDGAIFVRLGPGPRRVRVPIVPGSFDELDVAEVTRLVEGTTVEVAGPCVLAYDGERDRVLPPGAVARITPSRTGPLVVDVRCTLRHAAGRHLFDVPATLSEAPDGH